MYGSAWVFHVKRFYVPLGVAAAVAVVFALTFAFGQACPQGYTLTGGKCVQSSFLSSSSNIAIGPGNSTINGTVNIKDATPTTGATTVNIGLGASQGYTAATVVNAGDTVSSGFNFVVENGANNAITASLPGLSAPTNASGVCLTVYLQHTLQAGANTFALNGATAVPIVSHFGTGNIAHAYNASTLVNLCNVGGAAWVDMSQ
jgi:hypothetical protein